MAEACFEETPAAAPKVSVVIPSWNGKDLLSDCLASLDRQSFRDFETIVVDDGSTDGTVESVRQHYPSAQVIVFPSNRGFCHAVNAGIEAARGDLILLLNNDMTLDARFFENLVRAADSSSSALFAPLILWRDEPRTIYAAGDLQRANGRPESFGFRCPLDGFRLPERIFGITAGAGLYRREVFERIGLFDPAFKIYFSDSDMSFRARLAGFGAELVSAAIAYHVGSASLAGRTLPRTRQCYINHVMLLVKNMPFSLALRHAPAIVFERLHQARRLLSAARSEGGSVYAFRQLLSAWIAMLTLLPHAFNERRRIQKLCFLAPSELDALFFR